MKGYVSFILVLLASLALLDLLSLYSSSSETDLSQAVAAERIYGIEMNVKEALIASVRIGAKEGFDEYDKGHDIKNCRHCPDHFCALSIPANPLPVNFCDNLLCGGCFRESGARNSAMMGAQNRLEALKSHTFDQDFNISFHPAEIEILLRPDPFSKNGYSLDFARFRSSCGFTVSSEKFQTERKAKIPGGFIVESPGLG
jgi:hypothetical protein